MSEYQNDKSTAKKNVSVKKSDVQSPSQRRCSYLKITAPIHSYVIQRKLTIANPDTVLTSEDDIKHFLKTNGLVVYKQMDKTLLHNMLQSSKQYENVSKFIVDINSQIAGEGIFGSSAKQEDIQVKLAEVCKIMFDLSPESSDKDKAEVMEWLEAVDINGLCGGWTEMHRKEPAKLKIVWLKIKDWHPVIDFPANILDSLNEMLAPYTAEDAAALLLDAYNYQKVKVNAEIPDTYDDIPDAMKKAIKYEAVDPTIPKEEYRKDGFPYTELQKELEAHLAPGKIAIVSTDEHYMSIRNVSKDNYSVMESEEEGYVDTDTLAKAIAVVQPQLIGNLDLLIY